MEKQKEQVKKPLSLSEISEELIQLTDLAQAVNARCFFLREEIKIQLKKDENATT